MSLDRQQIIDSALAERADDQEAEAEEFERQQAAKFLSYERAWAFIAETPAAVSALTDLFEYILPEQSTYSGEPQHMALMEGRRSVWLLVQQRLRAQGKDIHQIVRGQ